MNDEKIQLFLNSLIKKNIGKNLCLFVIGTFLSALSFNLFYKSYDIMASGTGGLSLIIGNYISVNNSLLIFIIGLICLVLGLIFFGWKYALKMVMITFFYPLFVELTDGFINYVSFEDVSLFLIAIIGGGLGGFANGIIRNSGFNTGGFGVIFDIMYKYLHIGIGVSSIIINSFLIVVGSLIFGIDKGIYAIIALLTTSYMIDRTTIGISNNKVFYIITDKYVEVLEYLTNKLGLSVTVVDSRGGYTNKNKKMLMCVSSTREYVKIKELVKEIDPKVFFLIVDAYESSIK